MTIIRVDWYKKGSGKWQAGGEVDVDESPLYGDDFLQKIVDGQDQLTEGWQGQYDVVTRDLDENMAKSDYHKFYHALIKADRFEGLKRCPVEETSPRF